MAEKYRELGAAGDGMKTGVDALVEVVQAWENLRKDPSLQWVWCKHDKNIYHVMSQGGGGLSEMVQAASVLSPNIYFGGLRVTTKDNKVHFLQILFIPDVGVSGIQRGKAQLLKSGIFNNWPGSSGEVAVSDVSCLKLAIAQKLRIQENDIE